MERFLADEDLNDEIVRGLLACIPNLDLTRVQDVGPRRRPDPAILAWAAEQGRIVMSHDIRTMTRYAYTCIGAGLPFPGPVIISQSAPVGLVIENLVLAIEAGLPDDWVDAVRIYPQ